MINAVIEKAAAQFGIAAPLWFTALSSGLIHQTYHVWKDDDNKGIVLQQLNQAVFKEPQQIINNYNLVYSHLKLSNGLMIPEPMRSTTGSWLWYDDGRIWRANCYVPNSYTETLPITPEKARKAANSFAHLTRSLQTVDVRMLAAVIPDFHNLAFRFAQFQKAMAEGKQDRVTQAQALIKQLLERKHYVDFYNHLVRTPDFKVRIMHHDCKLSNVLFHLQTGEAICPIDLDTLMPGYYFSDLGDMVRSMAASADETEQDTSTISIRSDVYLALIEGYLSEMEKVMTASEKKCLHHSGLLMIYMQALRFLTDYLLGDVYYKISYESQNYDRALNQVSLLIRLEDFLYREFRYTTKA
jgi:hypothetical protein